MNLDLTKAYNTLESIEKNLVAAGKDLVKLQSVVNATSSSVGLTMEGMIQQMNSILRNLIEGKDVSVNKLQEILDNTPLGDLREDEETNFFLNYEASKRTPNTSKVNRDTSRFVRSNDHLDDITQDNIDQDVNDLRQGLEDMFPDGRVNSQLLGALKESSKGLSRFFKDPDEEPEFDKLNEAIEQISQIDMGDRFIERAKRDENFKPITDGVPLEQMFDYR